MYGCYRVQWTEYERGWGQRPDGTQYFATLEHAEERLDLFTQERAREQQKYPNSTPDLYSNPGTPTFVPCSQAFYESLPVNTNQGKWFDGDPTKYGGPKVTIHTGIAEVGYEGGQPVYLWGIYRSVDGVAGPTLFQGRSTGEVQRNLDIAAAKAKL